jgi:YbbR domain-containing protein
MQQTARKLIDNLGTIILSVLLAFVVWIAATLQDDPFTVREFANVPISRVGQPPNTVIYEPIADRVNVTVRAPQSVLQNLRLTDFKATLNLAQVEPGVSTTVPITVTSDNSGVRIEAVDPSRQTILLEAIGTITLPVTLQEQGQVATGYQALPPVISPSDVTIQGPAPLLTQVVSATGTIDLQGAKDNVVEQVAVTPVDKDGAAVQGLQWTPDRVEVRVGVRRKVGYKPDVEVVPDLRGQPAPGYRLGSVTVDPSTVTLAGLPSVLDTLPSFVETMPISVTGAIQNITVRTLLTVPNNVVVVDVNYVTVMVEVLPIQSSKAMTGTIEIQGIGPGLIATASPKTVDVILEGPDPVLAKLKPGDLQVVVNVFGLPTGVHRVAPDVVPPEGVTVVSVIPETIEVMIEAVPSPTPLPVTPTLTVTLTVTVQPATPTKPPATAPPTKPPSTATPTSPAETPTTASP